ncbi:16S rRNA (cytosine967-C5)-methyltransferase [Loktanella fryxellensis]|uniref:16S rRNA (Cytosine967-C5)-methyltransferase n=1 Tax=Loktanella fryxellensis TaxID=245187 RepID=A0A1H7ZT42_9RHOB|nr:RsmB/NOP family class I SAM-dependent RNA methyltransferase [Loktanella fryxellensis]SEM61595.1 16S rRNA (cytosine967-C5)-methyltransferase [Loktanella fryxellensis]
MNQTGDSKNGDQMGLAPRRAAHHLLQEVIDDGRLMSELLGGGALDHLAPDDRARAQRLATETLRMLDRADRMLKPFLAKEPPLYVRNALRLGTLEIVQGAAAYGVVNSYVEIVGRNHHTARLKGLVNAVLRNVADLGPEAWDKMPAPLLPGWLRQPLVAAWGRADVAAMEAVQATTPPLDLTPKGDAQAVAAAVGGTVLPTGSVRIGDAGQVTALPGYEAGDWWVQDAAAALPVQLLGDVTGLRVLDLCAAPGGKTMQLAARGAEVTAVDSSPSRMARVAQNLTRIGLNAITEVADAFDVTGAWDAVLLDAPCSATGTMRRHPDLPYGKDGAEFGGLIDQQGALIDHALTLLHPGGRLVFCTCSLLPDEGEVQIEEALARHPDLTVDRAALDRPGIDPDWITPEGGLRLRPDYWADIGGMDGFYMAVLTKPA